MSANLVPALAAVLALSLATSDCIAQSSAFTYQGRLASAGSPANGSYDLTFELFDAPTGGNQINLAITNSNQAVSNGLFSVALDFGTSAFSGSDRWLQIAVRTNGGAEAFVQLNPRQLVTPAPYALYALGADVARTASNVSAASITGQFGLGQLPEQLVTNGASGVSLSGSFAGSGSGLANLNAGDSDVVNSLLISCFGDSLTQGAGSSGGQTYPAQLGELLGVAVNNEGVGGWSSLLINSNFMLNPGLFTNTTIVWSGRNDVRWVNPALTLSNIANMVSNVLYVGNSRYLVMSILNCEGEGWGTTNYTWITNVNATLSATYSNHYVEVREMLVTNYNPLLIADWADFTNDIPPGSLRYEGQVHLNNVGYGLVASAVANRLESILSGSQTAITLGQLSCLMSAPGIIGGLQPNAAKFTAVVAGSATVANLDATNITADTATITTANLGLINFVTHSGVQDDYGFSPAGDNFTVWLNGLDLSPSSDHAWLGFTNGPPYRGWFGGSISNLYSSSITANTVHFPMNVATPTATSIGGVVGSVTNHLMLNVHGRLMDYWSDGTTLYSKQIAP
jgi:lysophospholipase L1-like esterase